MATSIERRGLMLLAFVLLAACAVVMILSGDPADSSQLPIETVVTDTSVTTVDTVSHAVKSAKRKKSSRKSRQSQPPARRSPLDDSAD